jgi:catechol 2,3-dioxygenase-like lactoylglutathione lyase family enzyme
MTEPLNALGAITMFIEDRDRARAFYERAFAAPPVYEDDNSVVFKLENTVINLLVSREAHDLIRPVTVAEPGTGSRFQLTVWVDDTDAACRELGSRGIELLNGPMDRPWGLRTAAFADPDGHVWEVAAEIRA